MQQVETGPRNYLYTAHPLYIAPIHIQEQHVTLRREQTRKPPS